MKTLAADRAMSAERALNTAIVNTDITRGYEEYLALVDQYYADDVEVSSDMSAEPVVGKDRLKSILFRFLGPLHMIAEIAGCGCRSTEPQYRAIPLTSSTRSGPSN